MELNVEDRLIAVCHRLLTAINDPGDLSVWHTASEALDHGYLGQFFQRCQKPPQGKDSLDNVATKEAPAEFHRQSGKVISQCLIDIFGDETMEKLAY